MATKYLRLFASVAPSEDSVALARARASLRQALLEATAGLGLGVGALALAGCGTQALEAGREDPRPDAAAESRDASPVPDAAARQMGCEQLALPPCQNDRWEQVKHLNATTPFDYLAFVSDQHEVSRAGRAGPCEEASSQDCLTRFQMALKNSVVGFVGTRGDDVFTLTTRQDFVSFFAPIDTRTEAAFLVHFSDGVVKCDPTPEVTVAEGIRCTEQGFEATFAKQEPCGGITLTHHQISDNGGLVESRSENLKSAQCPTMEGRAPDVMQGRARTRTTGVAQRLARSALMEAASVSSFCMLAEDLEALGAPSTLVNDARAAAMDEVRHAQIMATFAQTHVLEASVKVPLRPRKSLQALAEENAVEACVNETFAAVQALHQAEHARDPDLRSAMATIAADETRHAELGHAIAAWALPQLTEQGRDRIRMLQQEAADQLEASLRAKAPSAEEAELGLPTPLVASKILSTLRQRLWARA